ncbi:AbaSI family restriction endonuclease [Providencia manganoxydans]|uniref:AbaSI family restriction endonuclease n=1 Tax=Providencia manganoxydans TaxID=2923283 RepID=UPI0034DDBB29
MSKDDYILRALSKISHKRWEHYIINRIFHKLNDPDLEFVCQQCIRKEGHSGKIYLADLLFPQLKLYLEIDEAHHDSDEAKMADGIRRLDIMEATGFIEKRIPAHNTTLDKINHLVDEFIVLVRDIKAQQKVQGVFDPWEYGTRYTARKHIDTGFIEVGPYAVFRYHKDALECFGYGKKGHHQSGSWRVPEAVVKAIGLGGDVMVWFPRLYKAGEWDNSLSTDGNLITEKSLNSTRNYRETWRYRIVMAHSRDELNRTLYRFLGVFTHDEQLSSEGVNVFKRVDTRIKVYTT